MSRVDPYKNFRFLVEIEGITQAGFSECSGFGSEVEVIEYREGGEPTAVRKLPGRAKYPNITLRWAFPPPANFTTGIARFCRDRFNARPASSSCSMIPERRRSDGF